MDDTCLFTLLMFCVGGDAVAVDILNTYPAARLCEIMFSSELGDFRIFPDSSGFPDSTQNGFRISGLGGGRRGPPGNSINVPFTVSFEK